MFCKDYVEHAEVNFLPLNLNKMFCKDYVERQCKMFHFL